MSGVPRLHRAVVAACLSTLVAAAALVGPARSAGAQMSPAALTIDAPAEALVSVPVSISGRMTVGVVGGPLQQIEILLNDVVVTKASTDAAGHYSATVVLGSPGAHTVQARMPLAESPERSIRASVPELGLNGPDEVVVETATEFGGSLRALGEGMPDQIVDLYVDGRIVDQVVTDAAGEFTTTVALAEGERTLEARALTSTPWAVKTTKTVHSRRPIVDLAAPDRVLVMAPTEVGGQLTALGRGVPGAPIKLLLDGTVHAVASTDEDGFYRATVFVPEGGHRMSVIASDGTPQRSQSPSIDVFGERPTLSISGPRTALAGETVQYTGQLRSLGNGLGGETVELMLDGSPAASSVTDPYGTYTARVKVPAGAHSVSARALHGSPQATISDSITMNSEHPELTIAGPSDVAVAEPTPFTGRLTAFGDPVAGEKVEIWVSGVRSASAVTAEDGEYLAIVSVGTAGPHTVTARAFVSEPWATHSGARAITAHVPQLTLQGESSLVSAGERAQFSGTLRSLDRPMPGETVELWVGNAVAAQATTNQDGVFTAQVSLPEGGHVITAKAFRLTTRATSSNAVSVRSVRPYLSIAGPHEAPIDEPTTYRGTVAKVGKGVPGVVVDIYVDGTKMRELTTDEDGRFEVQLSLGGGQRTISARAFTGSSGELRSTAWSVTVHPGPYVDVSTGYGTETCAVTFDRRVACAGIEDREEGWFSPPSPTIVPGLDQVRSVSAVAYGACASRLDGTVWCWRGGYDLPPERVAGVTDAVQLHAAGTTTGCATTALGAVRCWDDGVTWTPIASGATHFAGFSDRACAVVARVARCWTISANQSPQVEANHVDIGMVAVGDGFVCGLNSSGDVLCSGTNTSGQLGDGTTSARTNRVKVLDVSGAVSIAAGKAHACAIVGGGSVRCWGSNSNSELGDGTQTNRSRAVPVNLRAGAARLSLGSISSCALMANNTARCWGLNSGQLGTGSRTKYSEPVPVRELGADVLPDGLSERCAALRSGRIHCWGSAQHPAPAQPAPRRIEDVTGAHRVATGDNHACALLLDGTVRCWGGNGKGQLGDGTTAVRTTPVDVLGLSDVIDIDAGGTATCAVRSGGDVWCWGRMLSTQTSPVRVIGVDGATKVSVGVGHACALQDDSGLRCWGENGVGQLGSPESNPQTEAITPDRAPSGVSSVSATIYATCVAFTNGSVDCWGGEWDPQFLQIPLDGLSDVRAVEAGAYQACALTNSGEVHCWGRSADDYRGGGFFTQRPTRVPLPRPAAELALGRMHQCARDTSGAVYCWGHNHLAQLGGYTGALPEMMAAPREA